ncbi:hypothetical protein BH23CHL4_BH23CHL4_21940 [soil metagenome]
MPKMSTTLTMSLQMSLADNPFKDNQNLLHSAVSSLSMYRDDCPNFPNLELNVPGLLLLPESVILSIFTGIRLR